jgi:hypothetical protein
MTIPKRVLELLAMPIWAYAGTRNKDLVPAVHMAWGVRVTSDRAHVEALVPAPFALHLRKNLADNGWFALTATESLQHETYQLKGHVTEVRDPTDEERAFQAEWGRVKVAHLAANNLMPPHLLVPLEGVGSAPSTFVRFKVEEIYVQTPGPTAGQSVAMEAS